MAEHKKKEEEELKRLADEQLAEEERLRQEHDDARKKAREKREAALGLGDDALPSPDLSRGADGHAPPGGGEMSFHGVTPAAAAVVGHSSPSGSDKERDKQNCRVM